MGCYRRLASKSTREKGEVMIQALVMTAAMTTGQVFYDGPVYYGPPVCQPAPIVVYGPPIVRTVPAPVVRVAPPTYIHLVGITVRSRADRVIKYGDVWKTVPIVNGYAPQIREDRYADGALRITYDYSRRIPYSKCVKPGQPVNRGRLVPVPKAKTVPSKPDNRPKAPREGVDLDNEFTGEKTGLDQGQFSIGPKEDAPKFEVQGKGSGSGGGEVSGGGKAIDKPKLPPIHRPKIDPKLRKPSDVKDIDKRISPTYRDSI